ncbi:hypothetical protein WMR10_000313 [Stenotrophomonas maltophilia]
MRWAAALLTVTLALLAPNGRAASTTDDMGQAMVNCQNNVVFNAGNSAKQCVVLGKIYDGSCAVGLKAISEGYISFFPYNCDKKCSTRPEEFGWAGGETSASVNVCERGCMYTSALDPQGAAGYSYSPTGGTCTTSDAPAPTPAGDGTDPGGGGGDTGGGDGGGTNPGGGDGDGGGGTNPGGGDGGGGTGPGDGDGGGEDGGGDGGGGTGPGPGPGEGDGDGDGPGTPGEDGGPLYERDKNLTIPKVYAEFEQRVKKAPIIDATKRFFTVSVGGSCPVFTVPASAYWEAMTFDLHCSGAIFALLQLIGWVLLAMAAYKAGEIALT